MIVQGAVTVSFLLQRVWNLFIRLRISQYINVTWRDAASGLRDMWNTWNTGSLLFAVPSRCMYQRGICLSVYSCVLVILQRLEVFCFAETIDSVNACASLSCSLCIVLECCLSRPVSAYALFFRDTQAAIKSHNPTASFGEMSKIVAAMWDSLDDLHKNVLHCILVFWIDSFQ